MRESVCGTSRHFAVTQNFGRFRSEADIEPPLLNPNMSRRPRGPAAPNLPPGPSHHLKSKAPAQDHLYHSW
jgi:hypothetical protein